MTTDDAIATIDSPVTTPPVRGAVLYTDGSARPTNPGYGGCGIHGYIYDLEESKVGTGMSDHLVTNLGYVRKTGRVPKEGEIVVHPVAYIDGYISFNGLMTNNVAELIAATRGIEYLLTQNVTEILILADSQYAIKASTLLYKWRDIGWKKPNGETAANVEELKKLYDALEKCKAQNVPCSLDWVEAHVGDLGNSLADALAAIGASYSSHEMAIELIEQSPPAGYWKYDADRHPFISHSHIYYNTLKESNKPGVYYLGNQGKNIDFFGKRVPDGGYAYVRISKPDEAIEEMRNYSIDIANGENAVIMGRLDYVYSATNHKFLSRYGKHALYRTNIHRLDMTSAYNKEPITHEFRPPKIAWRAIDALTAMENILESYGNHPNTYTTTDITNFIYMQVMGKKGKVSQMVHQLKPEFVVGYPAFTASFNYKAGAEIKSIDHTLTLGLDLPTRNALKRIETLDPKVEVVTWLESECSFRYAVIVHAGEDVGIWCAYYSNLRFFNT